MSLRKILNTPVTGNKYHDKVLIERIHDFIADEEEGLYDRLKALQHLSIVEGKGPIPMPTYEDLVEHLKKKKRR